MCSVVSRPVQFKILKSLFPPSLQSSSLARRADRRARHHYDRRRRANATSQVELAAWEIFETGKPWREADADVAEAIDFLEFYARDMQRIGQPRRLGHEPGEFNELIHEPRGVVAVIAPWNFPLAIPTGMVSAALVTGNIVLFKPSERSSILGHLLVELLHEAGVPRDVLQVLPGGGEIGHALATHPKVDLVAFTGSKDVGLRLLAESIQTRTDQRTIKKVIAEMGGKTPSSLTRPRISMRRFYGVMKSFTGYQGQKCSGLFSRHRLLLGLRHFFDAHRRRDQPRDRSV